jgi:hypothetical protein
MPKLKQFRKSFRSFLLNRLQRGWVEPQNLENGRSNLHGGDRDGYSISSEARIRNHIMTLVSSWEKPSCSASFLVLPE